MKRRAQQRGAAMPEAVVVVPFLVVFWGVMALAYAGAKARMTAQLQARTSVMYYALHECKESLPDGIALTTEEEEETRIPEATPAEGADAPTGGPDFETQSTFFFASGSAIRTESMLGRASTHSSRSWAACNEGVYDGDLFGLFAYGWDFFGDLLPPPLQGLVQ